MPISPEARYALDKADQYVKQVASVHASDDKDRLLMQTQILLLRAILTEIAEMRSEAKDA